MITDQQIDEAKTQTNYTEDNIIHEHNDCIRIAYEWFDAQKKTKAVSRKLIQLKHLIEEWGGRYVSRSDVQVAATLHPEIYGSYPFFNISVRLVEPSDSRLNNIGESRTQKCREYHNPKKYKIKE